MTDRLFGLIVFGLVIFLYYAVVDPKITERSRSISKCLRASRRHSRGEIDSIVKLILAGISQALLCCGLVLGFRIQSRQLFVNHVPPALFIGAVLLAAGEAGLSSQLCYVGIRAAMLVAPSRVPNRTEEWLTIAKAGWLRQFLRTVEIVPVPLVVLITSLYIGVEEIIFRGLLITYARPLGITWALGASTMLFVLPQLFPMTSWKSAMFPVIGAVVIGFVHGALFLAVPDIRPLIISHFLAFAFSVF